MHNITASCIPVLLPRTFPWWPPGLHHQPVHPQKADESDTMAEWGVHTHLGRRAEIFGGVYVATGHLRGPLPILCFWMTNDLMWLLRRPIASSGWTVPTGAMTIGCQESPITQPVWRTAWRCCRMVRVSRFRSALKAFIPLLRWTLNTEQARLWVSYLLFVWLSGNGKFNDFTCWEPQAFICSYPYQWMCSELI